MRALFFKRIKLIAVCLGLFALSFAVASYESDPLLISAKKLQQKVDAYFLIKGIDPKTNQAKFVGSDWIKPMFSTENSGTNSQFTKAYQSLMSEFKATKIILEKGFAERENEKTSTQSVLKAASAAKIYFDQEKRLYLDLFRNIHHLNKGNESDFARLKNLDLMLRSNVADRLHFDDQKFSAKYNLWHVRDAEGNFDQIEYGVFPAELSEMEQVAILSAPNQENYQKAVQLLVARERMTNRWALNRLQGGSTDKVSYPSCGKSLYSFRNLGNGNFYQSLWANDRAEEVSKLHKDFAQPTLQAPLLNAEELRKLMQTYFNLFPSFRDRNSGKDNLRLEGDTEKDKETQYWATAPQKLLDGVEKDWKKYATTGMESINYPSDSLNDEQLPERAAWVSFQFRQKSMIDIFTTEAQREIVEARSDQSGAWKAAEKIVKQGLLSHKREYLKIQKHKIQRALDSSSLITKTLRLSQERFDEKLVELKPAMTEAARAGFVLSDLDRAVKTYRDAWLSSGKATFSISTDGWDQFQLGYIPARGALREHLSITRPSELRLFFGKKLNYWSDLDKWWRRAGKSLAFAVVPLVPAVGEKVYNSVEVAQQAKRISRVATEVRNNAAVARGIQQFFKALHDAYDSELAAKHLTADKVNEHNSPLYGVLPKVVDASYKKFVADLSVDKHQNRKLDSRIKNLRPNATLASDQTRLKPALNPAEAPEAPTYIADLGERKKTIELYIQAFAMMNLAEKFLGADRAQILETRSIRMINTPLEMEHVLKHLNPATELSQMLSISLLDQKMLAEVIKTEKMTEQPLLGIREANNVDLPTLADGLYTQYSPNSGLNLTGVRDQVWTAVMAGIKNTPGLVEEACSADPVKKDQKFKNIFNLATNLRAAMVGNDQNLIRYDQELRLEFRSPMEKFKDDWCDPLLSVVMWVTTIAALIYFAPVAYAGLMTVIAQGSLTLASLEIGATGALKVLSAVTVKSVLSTLMSTTVAKIVAWLFFSQLAVWSYVNCYEYPAFGKYQLQVAQSQMSGTNPQVVNSDVISFHEEMFARKMGTAGFAAMILAPEGFFFVKSALKVAGRPAAAALSRLGKGGGEAATELASALMPTSLNAKMSLKPGTGTLAEHVIEKFSALKNLGRVNTLASNVSNEKLRELLTLNMTELLSSDLSILKDLYSSRAYQLNEEGARLMRAFRQNNLISKEVGHGFKVSPEMKKWIRLKATEIGFKNTHYWKMVVAEDALEAAQTGKLLVGQDNAAEIAGLVQYAYVKGLLAERDFLLQNKARLAVLMEAGELNPKQILKEHFGSMSDSDWSRIEELFQSQAVATDGRLKATINAKWMSDAPTVVAVKNTFQDYHVLREESDLIQSRKWGAEANEYFSNNGDHLAPTLLLESNSELKVKTSPHAAGKKYVELFFDADAFMALPTQ